MMVLFDGNFLQVDDDSCAKSLKIGMNFEGILSYGKKIAFSSFLFNVFLLFRTLS